MARNAGPKNGAKTGPEERTPSSQDPASPVAGDPSNPPAPGLDRGEPTWPEDPDALRVEALFEEGTGLALPDAASEPEGDNLRPLEPAGDLAAGAAERPYEETAIRSQESDAQPADEPRGGVGDQSPAFLPIGDATDSDQTRGDAVPGHLSAEPSSLPHDLASAEHDKTAAPVAAPRRRSGAGALLLGGMIAAALGFGAAWLARDGFGGAQLPAGLEERLAALETRPLADAREVQALAERLAEVETRLGALEEAPASDEPAPAPIDLEPLRQEIAAGLNQAEERAAGLEERLAALETRPAAPAQASLGSLARDAGPALRTDPERQSPDAASEAVATLEPRMTEAETALAEVQAALGEVGATVAALDGRVGTNETALSALDARLGEVEADLGGAATRLDQAETRLDEVEATGAAAMEEARAAAAALDDARSRAAAAEAEARREAAIAALDSALDAGQPFEAALPALDAEIPEALARAASEGLPSLAALRESFPEAARAGLAAAREEGLVEEGGVTGFLLGQLSVRSTAPREGDDADAVLSRAEAALVQGRLGDALAAVESLPEPVQAAMAGWMAQARARTEAEAALEALRAAEPIAAPAD